MNLRRKMGKRIASWFLCMVMVLTLIPATIVYADEPGLIIPNATISEDGILSWDPAESEFPEYPAPKIDDYEVVITDEGGGPTTYVQASVHGLSCDINAMCSDAGLSTGVYEIRLYAVNVEGFERWPKFLEYAYIAKTYINKVNIIGISDPIAGEKVGYNLNFIRAADPAYTIMSKTWWCTSTGHIKQMSSSDVFEEGLEYQLTVKVQAADSSYYMDSNTKIVFNGLAYGIEESYYYSGILDGYTKSIVARSHDFSVQDVTQATLTSNGKIVTKCKDCGEVSGTKTIYYPKTIKLSATTYTYDGKVKKPSVSVVDANGKTIAASNYTVTYASGRKNVGKYTVKVAFKGNYSGTKSLTFKINPVKTTIKTLTKGTKSFKVTWAKKSTQVTGYQIQYSLKSDFSSGNKTVTIKSYKTTAKTIKSLKAKKKYYVRVRTYKTVSGTNYYSGWSAKKYVTTK